MQVQPITERVAIAGQPTDPDLEELARQGYVGVINLRHDGEPDQPMGTVAEGERVRGLGMDYLHYGVGGAPLSAEGVEAVGDFLDAHAGGKVLVHCRRGSRAAALVLLHRARQEGWTADEALERGEAMGLKVEGKLREMVREYLGARQGG